MGEFTYLCVSILTNDWSYQEHFYCSNKHEKAIIFSKQLVDTFPTLRERKDCLERFSSYTLADVLTPLSDNVSKICFSMCGASQKAVNI